MYYTFLYIVLVLNYVEILLSSLKILKIIIIYPYDVLTSSITVFTLNFLPYKPTGPVNSNICRPTINSTGPNLKTTLMTINSNHQNSKHDDVPNSMWTCQLCIR